jgi:hypothetical protein
MAKLDTHIGYTWDAEDWTMCVKGASNKDDLIANISRWQPFVADALEAAKAIDWEEWMRERPAAYAENGMPSEPWMEKYGAIILPENLLIAGEVSVKFQASIGCCLLKLYEERPDLLRGIVSR